MYFFKFLFSCYSKMDKFHEFSVTIRPRSGVTDSDINLFRDWLEKQELRCALAALEMSGTSRHIQAAIRFKSSKRSDNLKRSLSRLFKVTDTDELQHAICVHKHNDFDGLIGYCSKENGPIVFRYSCALDYQQQCLQRYLSFCSEKAKKSVNRKSFFDVYKGLYGGSTTTILDVNRNIAKMLQDGYNLYWLTESSIRGLAPLLVNYCGYHCELNSFFASNSTSD